MAAIHYSRCIMVPTGSSLAVQLGLLEGAGGGEPDVVLELGDYEHKDDRLWLRHAGLTKHIWARSRGADTRVVGLSYHVGSQPIFALPGSGIAGPADLRGRRVAMIRSPGQAFDIDRTVFLKPYFAALASAGLTLSDVEMVESEVERELVQNATPKGRNFFQQVGALFLTQLIRGEVDAIATPLPPEVARFFDLRKIYDTREDPDIAARVELRAVVASGPLLREHRDVLVGLMAKVLEAGAWAQAHPDEVLAKLAADLSIDESILKARGVDGVALSRLELNDELKRIAEAKKAFLLSVGMIDHDYDLAEWIDGTVLEDARAALSRAGSRPSARR